MPRPFFSQLPSRIGSGPSRPPFSGAGVASGTDCSVFPGAGVWVVSPIIPGSRNCCSLIPGPGLDKLPDKPTVSAHAPDKPMFALTDHHLVTLRGRDAAAFAQAQFMSDVAATADGNGQGSGRLMPTGRVIALFAMHRADPETHPRVLLHAVPAHSTR